MEQVGGVILHFCPWGFFVRVVATTSIMSFVNGAIEALTSPNCLIINSYQAIFFLLSQKKLSSISIKLGNLHWKGLKSIGICWLRSQGHESSALLSIFGKDYSWVSPFAMLLFRSLRSSPDLSVKKRREKTGDTRAKQFMGLSSYTHWHK